MVLAVEGVSIFGATGTFTECNFSGNKQGAVLLIASSGTITNCTFNGNTTLLGGSAVQLVGSSVAITGCTMNGNTASIQGGAVSLGNASGTITNCTISGNTSPNGGGIAINATTGTATLAITSCTVANNTGTNNGGIFVQSTGTGTIAVTLRNTIIANNGSLNIGGSAAPGSFATVTSQGFNLTNDLTNVSLNQPTDIVNANPLLGPLQNNGGPTQTHALLVGSPAIDKGLSSGTSADQRGVTRPLNDAALPNATGGDGADIGAFERSLPAVVSASSYKPGALAQESIVAAFGETLTVGTASATAVPLPTTLDSTSVFVLDAQNTERPAPLFFVSPGQLNFQIPPGTAVGNATVFVRRSGTAVASTSITIAAIEPSLFTANSSGAGVPAAFLVRVKANNTQVNEPVAIFQGGVFVPAPISLGPVGESLILVLYGTGIRNRSALSAVTLNIGGTTLGVDFAGIAPGFIGLDQVNSVAVPRTLIGKGTVTVTLTADGKPTNTVTLNFQ